MATNTVRILSFDPGLTVSGWAVLDFNMHDGTMTVSKLGMLTPNKIVSRADMRDEVDKYGKRLMALSMLKDMVTELYEEYKPDYIAVEDNFFNSKYPTAYAALIHWTMTVDFLMKDKYGKPVYKIPPKLIKQYISGSGDASKVSVQQAIMDNDKIVFRSNQLYNNLMEHTADAIAIGWAFLQEFLPILSKELSDEEEKQ
jgi:Holliday junction resolvasome RuvABC endonuclease subunit